MSGASSTIVSNQLPTFESARPPSPSPSPSSSSSSSPASPQLKSLPSSSPYTESTAGSTSSSLPYPGYIAPSNRINPLPSCRPTSPLSQPSDAIQFHHLADVPHFTKMVCTAIYHEWKVIYQDFFHMKTVDDAIDEISASYCNRDQLNSCFVATIDGDFAGTAMLTTEDMCSFDIYFGTRPWLASLYIHPKYRGRGVCSALVNRLTLRAREMGYYHCWLMTQHMQRAYEKCGYRVIETIDVFGGPYTVMRHDFPRNRHSTVKRYTEEDARESHKIIHAHDTHDQIMTNM